MWYGLEKGPTDEVTPSVTRLLSNWVTDLELHSAGKMTITCDSPLCKELDMTRFNHCPNCRKRPSRGFLGGTSTDIHECKKCEAVFCYCYCGNRCPNCGSAEKRKIGYCPSK